MTATGQVERYRELRPIGSGGMGEVVLAEDTLLGRNVALKRLRASDDDRPELGRLRREALVGASFNHANLVAVYDTLLDGEDLVIVMEYVEGQTLRAALGGGAMPAHRAVAIVSQLAAALDHVHARNVVHRDVKPANVLLGLNGVVKLGDLGIASAGDRTRITSIGTVLGTIPYMAPEQLEPSQPTPAVDIYALGAVAFEALGGRRARNETNPLALAHALANQAAPDLRDVWPEAPADAAAVLAMAMSRDPAARPRSAGDLARRLKAAFATNAATAPIHGRLGERPEPPAAPVPRDAFPRRIPAASPPAAKAAHRVRPSRAATGAPVSMPQAASTHSRQWRLAALGTGLIALVAATVIAVSSLGGASGVSTQRAAAPGGHRVVPSHLRASAPAPARAAGAAAGRPASPAAAGSASEPVAAVENFYRLAAAHRFADAWALADPAFRAQLQGLRSFTAQQSAVRAIAFDSATVIAAQGTSATVAVRTTPTLDSGIQHCRGTVQLVRSAPRWLLHHIAIQC